MLEPNSDGTEEWVVDGQGGVSTLGGTILLWQAPLPLQSCSLSAFLRRRFSPCIKTSHSWWISENTTSARPQQPLQSGLPRSIHKASFLAPTTAASISICPHSVVSLHHGLQSLGGSGVRRPAWQLALSWAARRAHTRSSTSVSLSFLLCAMGMIRCPTW